MYIGDDMKARLYIVDEHSYALTVARNEITIKVPEPERRKGSQWKKTLVDIMSDLFQVEVGDYAFLWKTGGLIYGVYRIISRPYYIPNADNGAIFGLKIEIAYEFKSPIREYDVLNNPALKGCMWNVIGKKLAGKSRATTPLTKDEMQILIQMLSNVNSEFTFYQGVGERVIGKQLTVNMADDFINYEPTKLAELNIESITLRDGKNVKYEKGLELILNYFFREKSKKVNELGIYNENVIWFANYLPYGIERSEIDYIVQESIDGENITRVDVIELMKGSIDKDHVSRCIQYARWCIDSLFGGNNIIRPMLICGPRSHIDSEMVEHIENEKNFQSVSTLDIYTYEMKEESIYFEKIY